MKELKYGCCSAISPCGHQQGNPGTLCATCSRRAQEDTFTLPPAQQKQLDLANERVKLWKTEGPTGISPGQAYQTPLPGGVTVVSKSNQFVYAPNPPVKPVLGTQVGGSHYTDCKIQPIEYIWANGLGFSEGNIVKYVTRWKAKGGVKDLKKAHHHIALLIEHAEAEK